MGEPFQAAPLASAFSGPDAQDGNESSVIVMRKVREPSCANIMQDPHGEWVLGWSEQKNCMFFAKALSLRPVSQVDWREQMQQKAKQLGEMKVELNRITEPSS